MGWKAQFKGRDGPLARFYTKNKGEFTVPIGGPAWDAVEALPVGGLVEVEIRDKMVASITQLSDRPMAPGGPGGSSSAPRGRSPETERAIMFQSLFSSLCRLYAARDTGLRGSVVAQEALELVRWYHAAQGQAPAPAYGTPKEPDDEIPF